MNSDNTPIHITGDKSLFLSKTAIERFKKYMRTNEIDTVESNKYLKDGFVFYITKTDDTINAKIVSTDEEAQLYNTEMLNEKRQQLKQRLLNARKGRSQEPKRKLASMKRSVPEKLYNSYMNLISKYPIPNLPTPSDVINNIDKYRTQIATIMGMADNVSNDRNTSNAIKSYFTTLGNFLGIEPVSLNSTPQQPLTSFVPQQNQANSDTEDEDEAPTLVA
jgi:hypothetical protein